MLSDATLGKRTTKCARKSLVFLKLFGVIGKEDSVDATVILSKFNITNMRILVKAMGDSWVDLGLLVDCMITLSRKSDYFYLDEYSDQ